MRLSFSISIFNANKVSKDCSEEKKKRGGEIKPQQHTKK